MKQAVYITLVLVGFSFTHCKKSDKESLMIPVEIEIQHWVDSEALQMYKVEYENNAGNQFSVTRLKYYLSGFTLVDENGGHVSFDMAHLVDIEDTESLKFHIGMLPEGSYSSMTFHIGLISALNTFGDLPNTVAHDAMFWPEQMGGGYHFLKLEGHFIDVNSGLSGYALHLGTNDCLVDISMTESFQIGSEDNALSLHMNVMEWFNDPVSFDLDLANYTMGNDSLMQIITNNGNDVFSMVL